MRVGHTRQMFRITFTSLLYCVHFKRAQLMWNATHSGSQLLQGFSCLSKCHLHSRQNNTILRAGRWEEIQSVARCCFNIYSAHAKFLFYSVICGIFRTISVYVLRSSSSTRSDHFLFSLAIEKLILVPLISACVCVRVCLQM